MTFYFYGDCRYFMRVINMRMTCMKGLLLWLMGLPVLGIVLLYVFGIL
jgi:hypothetical protein